MEKHTIPLDYANELIYDLQKAFWDERGRGARFRMTTVGREIYKNKCLPLIKSNEIEHILQVIEKVLKDNEIASKIHYDTEERLLHVTVHGCIHRPVEEKMVAQNIEPFTCIPANLIVLAIEEKLNRPVEIAEIKFKKDACKILLVLFERRPNN
jgi:hypothetical protein